MKTFALILALGVIASLVPSSQVYAYETNSLPEINQAGPGPVEGPTAVPGVSPTPIPQNTTISPGTRPVPTEPPVRPMVRDAVQEVRNERVEAGLPPRPQNPAERVDARQEVRQNVYDARTEAGLQVRPVSPNERAQMREEVMDARQEAAFTGEIPPWRAGVEVRRNFNNSANTTEGARERVLAEIERRNTSLEAFQMRIENAPGLSDEARTRLLAGLETRLENSAKISGLVAAGASQEQIRSAIEEIRASYDGYKAILPQVALVASAERILSVSAQLEAFSQKLSERASAGAVDISALLNELESAIDTAKSQGESALASAKALDGSQEGAVMGIRSQIQAGQDALKNARETAREIITALGVTQ